MELVGRFDMTVVVAEDVVAAAHMGVVSVADASDFLTTATDTNCQQLRDVDDDFTRAVNRSLKEERDCAAVVEAREGRLVLQNEGVPV